MNRLEVDVLWQKAMHEAIKEGCNLTRYHFAEMVAAHEREKEIKRVAEGHGWTQEHWTAYEESIAAAEREACAKVCEEMPNSDEFMFGTAFAAAIRARGEK